MKFRVERDVLADAVAWTARALPVRPSAPVLAGLLIEAGSFDDGEGLRLSTFDYETSARATLNAEIDEEGRALVSGRLLADICRSLPAKPVDIDIDGAKVTLVCGSARFSLQTMPVEDYPTLPTMPEVRGTVPSPSEFVKGDRFAPRSDHPTVGLETRPVLKPVAGSTEHYYAITPELEAILGEESHS